MKYFEYAAGGFVLMCTLSDEDRKAVITGYKGGGSNLNIPDMVDARGVNYRICSIGKKAFMACTALRSVSIPGTVELIGDWAFSGCRQLKDVFFRGSYNEFRSTDIAVGVFTDCFKIENICIDTCDKNDLSALLATVIHRMKAEYLLKDTDLGYPEWYGKWDMALDIYLAQSDDEGYTDMVLCGEEDLMASPEEYITDIRRNKAGLCFIRLLNDACLSPDYRRRFEAYLLDKGIDGESDEAWQALRDDFSDRVEYFRLYADIGGISAGVIDDMLIGLGEQHAEAKAFLIGYKQDNYNKEDIFDSYKL